MNRFLTPLRILLVFLGISIPVAFVLPHLDVGLEPPPPGGELEVRVMASGLSPYEMEQQVLSRLENALSAIQGVKGIRSVARVGEGVIRLEFSDNVRARASRLEVAAVLRRIYPTLPEGTSYPVLERDNPGAGTAGIPVLNYYVFCDTAIEVSCERAEAIFREALKNVESISAIHCSGGRAEEVRVVYDPEKISNFGIRAEDVQSALFGTYRQDFSGLAGDGKGNIYPLHTAVPSFSPAESARLLLQAPERRQVELSDVAEVVLGYAPPEGYFRVNGREVVQVQINIYAGTNSIREAQRIRRQVEKVRGAQQGLYFDLAQDYTEHLRAESSRSVRRTIMSVLILLVLLGISYRNVRMSLVLVFSLGIAVSLSLVSGWAIGLKWHPYTLAGMGVGFGLVVDNVIVMLDSCRKGSGSHIFPALLTATLTSATSLLVVFLLPGEYRRNLEDFAVIIILGLVASVLTVRWLVPACYSLWARRAEEKVRRPMSRRRQIWCVLMVYKWMLAFWGKRKGIFIAAWILAFGLPVFLIPRNSAHTGLWGQFLNTDFFQRTIRPPMEYLLGGSMGLFVARIQEQEFFRSPEPSALFIRAELPEDHTPVHLDALLRPIESLLGKWKGVSNFYTIVQDGRFGEIEVRFSPSSERTGLPLRVQAAVQHFVQGYSGVQWHIFGQGTSFANTLFTQQMTPSELVLKGYDYLELGRQAEKVAALLGRFERISDIRTDLSLAWGDRRMEVWRFLLDFSRLAANETTAEAVVAAIRQEAAPVMFNLEDEGRVLSVRAESGGREGYDFFRLLHHPLILSGGRVVYLRDLGQLESVSGNNSIYRENRQYIHRIGYDYVGDYGQVRAVEDEILQKIQSFLPAGFSVETGVGNSLSESGRFSPLLCFLLAGINFFFCALHFESFRKAFVILVSVPVSFIGVFLVFGSGYFYFDQGGLASMVLLGGIVVNAIIFILSDLEHASGKQTNFNSVLVKVVFRRSGAILLTVASTVCGLIPFLAAGPSLNFWFAFAAGTIGGLLMSLVAVFGLVPVILCGRN